MVEGAAARPKQPTNASCPLLYMLNTLQRVGRVDPLPHPPLREKAGYVREGRQGWDEEKEIEDVQGWWRAGGRVKGEGEKGGGTKGGAG